MHRLSCPRLFLPLAATGLLLGAAAVQAGRPLSTDDAGVAADGTCQLEAWLERSGGDGALILAPACGVAAGVEVGGDYAAPKAGDAPRATSGVAVKWAPAAAALPTPVGELALGLKAAAAFERPRTKDWQGTDVSVLVLATLMPSNTWSVHANAGMQHLHHPATNAALVNLAATWSPHGRTLLFAEAQWNDRPALLGRTVRSVGARWWLDKDRLGLDVTAGREAGGTRTTWTAGIGWYGIGL